MVGGSSIEFKLIYSHIWWLFHFFLIWLTWRFTHLLVIKSLLHPITTHDSLYTIMQYIYIYILYYDNYNSYPMLWSHDLLHNISWYITMTIPTPSLSMFIPTFSSSPGAFLGSSNRGLRCELRVGDRAQRGPTRRLSHAAGFLCRSSSFFCVFSHETCTLW